MASSVEKVIDFLERFAENENLQKTLKEDIEWAVEIISANKLYTGTMNNINFNTERPEIRAWLDIIHLRNV